MILVCNIGSTSLKFRLFAMPDERLLARGGAERIGAGEGDWTFQAGHGPPDRGRTAFPEVGAALSFFEERLRTAGLLTSLGDLAAVGFKVVAARGVSGTRLLDDAVLGAMEEWAPLFPAHNPPYVAAVRAVRRLHPGLPCIGTFETTPYDGLPPATWRYPVPLSWEREYGIRRLGFHGASHRYVAARAAALRGTNAGRLVSCHLGGSSSLCALRDGRVVDSSWGMTPQSGLPQNNRVGDIDVFAVLHLVRRLGLDAVESALGRASGLQGMAGTATGDLRDIRAAAAAGHADAATALDVFVREIRRHLGSLLVALGGIDCLVFTAGIGENHPWLRARIVEDLGFAGLHLDPAANEAATGGAEALLSLPGSPAEIRVIPTNEEIVIARDAWALLHPAP